MRSHAPLADAAVYVLRAMEPAEELEYRDHLAGCAECREEVAALQQVVDALALSAPQYAAPATLRDSVLRSIDADQPERPSRRRVRWFGALSVRPVYAAAAGMLVVLAAVAAVAFLGGGSGATRTLQARVQGSPGRAVLQLSHGRSTLIVRQFPAPAPGHVYEVWLERAHGSPVPTQTLFSVTHGGAADVGLTESLTGVRQILVTQEPAGGSVVSTQRPLIVAPVV
jgi:anti-sigma factor RsiW